MGATEQFILDEDELREIQSNLLQGQLDRTDKWKLDTILSAIATGHLIANPDKMKRLVHDITTFP